MLSRLALLGVASLAVALSPAQAVGKKSNMSWGKAGISFVQYRADALDCANRLWRGGAAKAGRADRLRL
jgi:hypothetical protein